MKHLFTRYNLTLVKENSGLYEVDNKISNPDSVAKMLNSTLNLSSSAEERLILICLDTKHKVTGLFEVSRGSINAAMIHPREVFKRALLQNSASIIIAHNHPSGDTTPSQEDINSTKRLVECGKILGVELIDHIIVGDNSFTSLKERGVINA